MSNKVFTWHSHSFSAKKLAALLTKIDLAPTLYLLQTSYEFDIQEQKTCLSNH